jgi:hypothetical protein
MKPVWMTRRHEPPRNYGDCLSACVASILECDAVPHFMFDAAEPDIVRERLDAYLSEYHNLTTFNMAWSGEYTTRDDLLAIMEINNPGIYYILWGGTVADEPHAVVCCGGHVVHDPSPWLAGGVVGPYDGVFSVTVFVPLVVRQ